MKRITYFLVYIIIRYIIAALGVFEDRMSRRIGKFIGRTMFFLDAKHRKIATKNLQRAEGMPKDDRKIHRLVRKVYEHFGISAVETLLLPRVMAKGNLLKQVKLVDFHNLDAALAKGHGAILIAPHLGNWEIAALAVAEAGYDINSVTRPVDNFFLHRYLLKLRTSTGHTLIPRQGAVRAMVECLKRNAVLVILADQNAHDAGVVVDFFGRPASTGRTPAVMSLKYGAPIVCLNLYRSGPTEYIVKATTPIDPPTGLGHEEAVVKVTQTFTQLFEEFIREHPDQWLWLHRRWRGNPELAAKPKEELENASAGKL